MVDSLQTKLKTMPLMKSVRYHGPGDIRVEKISEPICGRGEVKVYFTPSCLMLDVDGERFDLRLLEYAVVVCSILCPA